MPTYTFIKERSECGNIEGCKFVGDVFRTHEDEIADRLRKSATFGKTVKEINDSEKNPEIPTPPIIDPEPEIPAKPTLDPDIDLHELTFAQVSKIAKDLGIKVAGTKNDIIADIEKVRDERQ